MGMQKASELDPESLKDKQLILVTTLPDPITLQNVLLHSADISNLTRPFEISEKWSNLVFEEFLHQGDMERSKGLEVSYNSCKN